MIARIHILELIRRRRARLGGFVLALFAAASATAGAVPCLSMGAAANADSDAHPAAHFDSMPRPNHEMPASDHDHSHAVGHDAFAPTGGSTGSPSLPSDCPHCPLAASMPGHAAATTHSVCSAADDTSDLAQPGTASLVPKYVLVTLTYEPPPLRPALPTGARAARALVPASSPVPLNLRHCVFLI